jgi:glutamyl/glutaminyl-tRNA synthetase
MNQLVTRFAPTPSGYLHIGNLMSFAITWAIARRNAGHIILRIDDLDRARFRTEYLEDIFASIDFLGLDYDQGPSGVDDFLCRYSQQHKIDQYQLLLDRLVEKTAVYACTCSRHQILQHSPRGLYSGICARKKLLLDTENAAWRLRMGELAVITIHDQLRGAMVVNLKEVMPDFVVRRKDGLPAYQVASLADDLDMNVNVVVRGMDLLPSTAAQIYMSRVLELSNFEEVKFLHHPLLLGVDGEKLSKSRGDTSLWGMRKNGATASDVWGLIASHLNIKSHKVQCAADFYSEFSLDLLKQSDCCFSK